MIECKICGCDIEYEGLDNVSPFAGCPICERCIDDMMCEDCCDDSRLFYVESLDAILCEECLLKRMEKEGAIHSSKSFIRMSGTKSETMITARRSSNTSKSDTRYRKGHDDYGKCDHRHKRQDA